MAETLKRPLITVACNEDTSSSDLLGRYLIKGAETVWQDGPLTQAVRQGAIVYFDEIAEAREDVIVAVHPLTDHRREIYLDRLNESIKAGDGFMFVASYNPGYQVGMKEMKPSTRQRFVHLRMNYLNPELESKLLVEATGLDKNTSDKLVLLAKKIRELKDLQLKETVSTRLLVNAAQLIVAGMPARRACLHSIAEVLSDDVEVVNGLRDLTHLSL